MMLFLPKLTFVLLLSSLITGCFGVREKAGSETKVSITIPTSMNPKTKVREVYRLGESRSWGVQDPTTLSEVKCLGVIVSWDGSSLSQCTSSSGATLLSANLVVGTIDLTTAPKTFDINIPSGSGRSFSVVGLARSSNGTCPNLNSLTALQRTHLSAPFILGQKVVDIVGASMSLTLEARVTGAQKIANCSGPLFAWESSSTTNPTPIAASIGVTTTLFEQGGIKLVGTNLDSVTAAQISGGGITNTLTILSQTATEIFLKASSALSLAIGQAYSLVLTTAAAQTTFTITINGSKTTIQEISTAQTVAPTVSDTTYVITQPVVIGVPAASTYGDGFKINFKNSSTGLIMLNRSGTDLFDATSEKFFLVTNGSSVQFASAGNNWHALSSHGLATGTVTCSGDGSSDDQCYNNNTAKLAGVAIVGGVAVIWDGTKWYKQIDPTKFLINDQNAIIAQVYTTSSNFATIGATHISGYASDPAPGTYYTQYMGSYSLSSEFGVSVGGWTSNQDDYLLQAGKINSTNVCTVKGLRLPKFTETKANYSLGVPSQTYSAWTASTGNGSSDFYKTWVSISGGDNHYSASNYVICVIGYSEI